MTLIVFTHIWHQVIYSLLEKFDERNMILNSMIMNKISPQEIRCHFMSFCLKDQAEMMRI